MPFAESGSSALIENYLSDVRQAAEPRLLESPGNAIVMDGSQSTLVLHWSGSSEEGEQPSLMISLA